ncbi:MAG: putative HTH-type transcriptional regulator [Luteibacter sp.]|uniref:TetR/AcrR family transcriptional regulator n=1 Tax=Luteibacter sp. TaxID=1886636 RepID=UPI0013847B86|nr:TetR/AcrR family transcriptional regulator [Luteibacter sp.]KAF1005962.1 MAG: putative HTH-type transcriptional regulator [Luteibacter sp.]
MNTSATPQLRPGGRSARVQAAVHQAVRELQQEDTDGLTVPAIASRAGVTPSTIYRRWGDLTQLLADVAVEQMRPDTAPPDTGTYRGDLETWLGDYLEEIASEPGRKMLRDVLCTPVPDNACRCAEFMAQQVDIIRERAIARGEHVVSTRDVIDHVLSPLLYRILFASEPPSVDDLHHWIAGVLGHRR